MLPPLPPPDWQSERPLLGIGAVFRNCGSRSWSARITFRSSARWLSWKRPNNAKQDLRVLLAQIDAKALIPIVMQRDQLAAIVLVDREILFAFQVCRRGSDDTALGLGLCVDADGPGEGECWTAWNFVERYICVASVRRF
jgi:hypothetical protein